MMRLLALAGIASLAGCQQAPPAAENAAAPTPASSATTAPAPASETSLSRYVGKYSFDTVGGTRFVDDPRVRSAVERTVDDPAVRALVLGDATAFPIAERDGQIVAGACEPHNCGEHNWAILIRPDGSAPQVCHKRDGAAPRWYGETPVGAAKDSCPQE